MCRFCSLSCIDVKTSTKIQEHSMEQDFAKQENAESNLFHFHKEIDVFNCNPFKFCFWLICEMHLQWIIYHGWLALWEVSINNIILHRVWAINRVPRLLTYDNFGKRGRILTVLLFFCILNAAKRCVQVESLPSLVKLFLCCSLCYEYGVRRWIYN